VLWVDSKKQGNVQSDNDENWLKRMNGEHQALHHRSYESAGARVATKSRRQEEGHDSANAEEGRDDVHKSGEGNLEPESSGEQNQYP